MKVKFCPICTVELTENKKLSQGIWECKECGHRFYILITSKLK
jgi:ribosomal protein L37AE/L43A